MFTVKSNLLNLINFFPLFLHFQCSSIATLQHVFYLYIHFLFLFLIHYLFPFPLTSSLYSLKAMKNMIHVFLPFDSLFFLAASLLLFGMIIMVSSIAGSIRWWKRKIVECFPINGKLDLQGNYRLAFPLRLMNNIYFFNLLDGIRVKPIDVHLTQNYHIQMESNVIPIEYKFIRIERYPTE